MNPRKPTEEEKQELFAYLIAEECFGMGMVTDEEVRDTFHEWINSAPVAVFDTYAEYEGKVLVTLPMDGLPYPEDIEVYRWHDGKITKMSNKKELKKLVVENLRKPEVRER